MFEDKEWAQYLLGALEVMQYAQNWYESGDLTPEEAAEAFRLIVQDAPYNLRTCPNPAGGKIFGISSTGHVQEYGDAGEWQEPTGDATIPPVPEREGGSTNDQICLAAKNAANVLSLVYENLTDSFNDGLDEAEAATALTLTLIALIGAEFAPITFALVTFFSVVFSVLYGVLEFVGADLWDELFTAALVCILRDCANNDAGVVTFDWECFQAALAKQTNVFDLTFEQLRLFGQIEYILLVIGGVDALNAAGATTAITDDDCDECACTGTSVNFAVDDQGFSLHAWDAYHAVGTYSGGFWHLDYYPNSITPTSNQLGISGDVEKVCGSGVNININLTAGAPTTPVMQMRVTTSTQVKNATFTPVNGSNNVLWDEGGTLDEDAGFVEIGYIGAAGYGGHLGSFQTGGL